MEGEREREGEKGGRVREREGEGKRDIHVYDTYLWACTGTSTSILIQVTTCI